MIGSNHLSVVFARERTQDAFFDLRNIYDQMLRWREPCPVNRTDLEDLKLSFPRIVTNCEAAIKHLENAIEIEKVLERR